MYFVEVTLEMGEVEGSGGNSWRMGREVRLEGKDANVVIYGKLRVKSSLDTSFVYTTRSNRLT
jgi:hypothetical protein